MGDDDDDDDESISFPFSVNISRKCKKIGTNRIPNPESQSTVLIRRQKDSRPAHDGKKDTPIVALCLPPFRTLDLFLF